MKNTTVRQLDSHTWQFTEKLLGEAATCWRAMKEVFLLIRHMDSPTFPEP